MSIRVRSCIAVAALVLGAGSQIQGQVDSGGLPAFEVASIKPRTGATPVGFPPQAPDRFVSPDITASQLIRYAYDMQEFQIIGGPSWLRSSRFDVSAKAEGPTTQDRMRLMVRRLLADRFGLRAHAESRELSTYALVVARADGRLGEHMRPSAIDCQAIIAAGKVRPPTAAAAAGLPPQCAWRIAITASSAQMMVDGVQLARFATLLGPMARRTVVDRTGLAGTYDIDLEFLPDQAGLPVVPVIRDSPAPPARDGLSLFTALQEQLGLKLESERGPVNVLVIDGAELPAPN